MGAGMKKIDIKSGDVFGRLVISSEIEMAILPSGVKTRRFECNCECGKATIVRIQHLTSGKIKSCGCLHDEFHETHARSRTKEYRIWIGMKSRCLNKNHRAYANYGGRGITLSDEWNDSFEKFYSDMGDCPKGMSIDRINNDGNYEKFNCRWATRREQSRNTSRSIVITFEGKTMILMDWANTLRVPYYRLRTRIKQLGWTVDRAFTEGISQGWRIV